jgi:hypothetical protein
MAAAVHFLYVFTMTSLFSHQRLRGAYFINLDAPTKMDAGGLVTGTPSRLAKEMRHYRAETCDT